MIDPAPLRSRSAPGQSRVLRLPAAAAVLGVSTRTVRRLVTRGDLRASRLGRMLLIEQGAIEALLARTRIGGIA